MTAIKRGMYLAFWTCAIIALSSIVVAFAQTSIPKPSAAEFTLKVIDSSYNVQPTYTTDPYTGKSVTVSEGYRAQNGTVQVEIRNQPLADGYDGSGHALALFYSIQTKGHFEGDLWDDYPSSVDGVNNNYLPSSNSDFTVISLAYGNTVHSLGEFPSGGQIDFRVQAFIGYATTVQGFYYDLAMRNESYTYQNYTGQAGDWSSVQTITIPQPSSPSETPSPKPTPSPSETATPSPSPSTSPYTSTTSQPTLEPSSTPNLPKENLTAVAVVAGALTAIIVIIWLITYLVKERGRK